MKKQQEDSCLSWSFRAQTDGQRHAGRYGKRKSCSYRIKAAGGAESNMSPCLSVIYRINPSFFTSGEMRRIFSEINVSTGGQHQAEGGVEMQHEVN